MKRRIRVTPNAFPPGGCPSFRDRGEALTKGHCEVRKRSPRPAPSAELSCRKPEGKLLHVSIVAVAARAAYGLTAPCDDGESLSAAGFGLPGRKCQSRI